MYKDTISRIVIWKKNNNEYYYKVVKTHYVNYYIGYVNQYGHEIVLIIDDIQYRIKPNTKKQRIKKELISLINKI